MEPIPRFPPGDTAGFTWGVLRRLSLVPLLFVSSVVLTPLAWAAVSGSPG
jgi:hypothetical protein